MSAGTGVIAQRVQPLGGRSSCTSSRSGSCPSATASRPRTSRSTSRPRSAAARSGCVASRDGARRARSGIHQDVDLYAALLGAGECRRARAAARAPRLGPGRARALRAERHPARGRRRRGGLGRDVAAHSRARRTPRFCCSTSPDEKGTPMSTITTKDGTRALLQGLGQGAARRLQPRLAAHRGRLGRPDAVPRRARLPLHRARPPRPRPLEPAVERQRHGHLCRRPRGARRGARPRGRDPRRPLDGRRRSRPATSAATAPSAWPRPC